MLLIRFGSERDYDNPQLTHELRVDYLEYDQFYHRYSFLLRSSTIDNAGFQRRGETWFRRENNSIVLPAKYVYMLPRRKAKGIVIAANSFPGEESIPGTFKLAVGGDLPTGGAAGVDYRTSIYICERCEIWMNDVRFVRELEAEMSRFHCENMCTEKHHASLFYCENMCLPGKMAKTIEMGRQRYRDLMELLEVSCIVKRRY